MIHPAIKKTQVALRYYKIVYPERNYDDHNAVRQFNQDKKINNVIVLRVITEIFKEQKEILKK